jgi:hypothetical protein
MTAGQGQGFQSPQSYPLSLSDFGMTTGIAMWPLAQDTGHRPQGTNIFSKASLSFPLSFYSFNPSNCLTLCTSKNVLFFMTKV